MKKSLFIGILAAAAVSSSCSLTPRGYEIKGTANSALEGKMVFLGEMEGKEFVARDTAIVQGGEFLFKGNQDSIRNFVISTERVENLRVPLTYFVLENAQYSVSLDTVISVKGTPLSDSLRALIDGNLQLRKKLISANREIQRLKDSNELTPEKEAELKAVVDSSNKQTEQNNIEFIEANKNNVAGALVFSWNAYAFDDETKEKIINSAGQEFKSYPGVAKIKDLLDVVKRTAEGQVFVDVVMPTPDGTLLALSDVVRNNKLTLVDFWATWCAPCRAEMPNVISIYEQYKDKGLEVVGISFDKDETRWKDYIKDNNIKWKNMSELQHWQSEAGRLYGVNSIPHVMIIDKSGKIVSRGLHGQELREKVEELLK
ncbi:MAG: thioredoxin-like domain-containing protein [Bacteroidales bacterium]